MEQDERSVRTQKYTSNYLDILIQVKLLVHYSFSRYREAEGLIHQSRFHLLLRDICRSSKAHIQYRIRVNASNCSKLNFKFNIDVIVDRKIKILNLANVNTGSLER
jgi:hypothetical protein